MLLTQIILRFDENVPDTSEAEDEYSKNIFRMYFDGNSVCEEQIPATVKGIACNIFPRRGFGTSISNIEIQPMYACQYGGTIDLLFTKIG